MNGTGNTTISTPDFWDDDFRILQPVWDLRIGYEGYIASPLCPIFVAVSFYFVSILPWMVIDIYGKNWTWIYKYKIQPDVEVTWPMVRKAAFLTTWNNILYILPVAILQWVFDQPMYMPLLAPTLWEILWQHTLALIIFDTEYFIWHSTHHKIRFLYKHVHSVHHQYHAPNSWVTQYLHPWELVSVGIFTATSPRFFDPHPITYILFQQLSIWVSVEAHIGYDLPTGLHHYLSFWGGSIKHDMHHQKPLTNFAPFYNWWDKLFGSFCPGQLAGGHRPKELLDWEKKNKEFKAKQKALKMQKAEQNGHTNGYANGHANGNTPNSVHESNGKIQNGFTRHAQS